MSTRADFYIGRGPDAEWIGSIAMDGSPAGVSTNDKHSTGGHQALTATTESEFRTGVQSMAQSRRDFTAPEEGWPWPWADSATTDYAYAFESKAETEQGKVYACAFGSAWWVLDLDQVKGGELTDDKGATINDGPPAVFPGMTDRMNVRWDEGSGVTIY